MNVNNGTGASLELAAPVAPLVQVQTPSPITASALSVSALLQGLVQADTKQVEAGQAPAADTSVERQDTALDLAMLPAFAWPEPRLGGEVTPAKAAMSQATGAHPAAFAAQASAVPQSPQHLWSATVTVADRPVSQGLGAQRLAQVAKVSETAWSEPLALQSDEGLQSGMPALRQVNLDTSAKLSAAQQAVPVNKDGQPVLQALAHKIQFLQIQGAEIATVRLDPPQMGSLEIRIRHDATGAVHVQMQASNAEVGRQLTTLIDPLRQELQQRSTDAQVTVASSRAHAGTGGHSDHQRQQAQEQDRQDVFIGHALQAWDGETLT